MSHRITKCTRNTNEFLKELERDQEFDTLRQYLTENRIFPRNRDPATAPIRFEELKELAKKWKLHRQRNFWRNHSTKQDLIRTLHKHINTKIIPQQQRRHIQQKESSGSTTNNVHQPDPTAIAASPPMSPRLRRISMMLNNHVKKPTKEEPFMNKKYTGDLFGTRGNYDESVIYMSRFELGNNGDNVTVNEQIASEKELKKEQKEMDEDPRKDSSSEPDELDEDNDIEAGGLVSAKDREIELKRRCACSLYQISLDEGNEAVIVAEGCVPAIVRLSLYDDMIIKQFCSGAIVNLMCNPSACHRMIEEGVLTALSDLSKAQNEEVRRNASISLCRTSYDRHGQLRLVQEGGVSSMLAMVSSPDFDTREACAKALINVASFSGSAVAESVVHMIILMCQELLNVDNLAHKQFAALAIRNLSSLSGSRVKAIDYGILEAVMILMKLEPDDTIEMELAIALCNFTGNQSNHEDMADVRVLESLKLLITSQNNMVLEKCAITVANLSFNSLALDNLVLNGMIPQLIRIGIDASEIIFESVAQALSNMATVDENRPILAKEGVTSLLVHYIQQGNIKTKQFAVITLCNMMVNPSTTGEVVKHNIVPCLVSLSKSPSVKIKEICALALRNLSCDENLQDLINTPENISALCELAESCSTSSAAEDSRSFNRVSATKKNALPVKRSVKILSITQEYCLGSIYNLSFLPKCRELLIQGGIVTLFHSLFSSKKDQTEAHNQQYAAILCNLSFLTTSRAEFVSQGSIALLATLIASTTAKNTLLCCATALCNAAVEALEAQTPILDILIPLSNTQHMDITLCCAMAFSRLASYEKTYRKTLTTCLELAPTLTKMMRSGHEEIQIHATVALCNLACEVPVSRSSSGSKMWKAGTIPDFIVNSLLRINSESTKEICAKALFNLLTHEPTIRQNMIDQGVLYALVKLARLESHDIRSLCVTALHNLSCYGDDLDSLMEINVTQVITKMCESESTLANAELEDEDHHAHGSSVSRSKTNGALASNNHNNNHNNNNDDDDDDDDDGQIWNKLAACLNNIARKEVYGSKLVEGGTLAAVQILVKNVDATGLLYCASILCYLSFTRESALEMIKTSSTVSVLHQFMTSTDTKLCVLGLQTLCNLSCLEEYHDRMIQSGILPTILARMRCGGDHPAKGGKQQSKSEQHNLISSTCCAILLNLNRTLEHGQYCIQQGIVEALEYMLVHYQDQFDPTTTDTIFNHISCLMTHFTQFESLYFQLLSRGIIRIYAIVSCKRTDDDHGARLAVLDRCLVGLSHLSRYHQVSSQPPKPELRRDSGIDEELLTTAADESEVISVQEGKEEDTAQVVVSDTNENETLRFVEDGILNVLEAIIEAQTTTTVIPTLVARQCAMILRHISLSPVTQESLSQRHAHLVSFIGPLTQVQDRDTLRSCAIFFYNVINHSPESGPNAAQSAQAAYISMLIRLSQFGNVEIRQICAITLVHLNSDALQEQPSNDEEDLSEDHDVVLVRSRATQDQIKNGMVSTLVSMLDMDQPTVKKIDKLTHAFAPKSQPPRREPVNDALMYVSGSRFDVSGSTKPGLWSIQESALDEKQYIPVQPKTYLTMLHSSSADASSTIQDQMMGGQFAMMHVADRKITVSANSLASESKDLETETQAAANPLDSSRHLSFRTTPSPLVSNQDDHKSRTGAPLGTVEVSLTAPRGNPASGKSPTASSSGKKKSSEVQKPEAARSRKTTYTRPGRHLNKKK